MNLIRSLTAYYPAFHLSCEPRAVECQLHEVEANGRRYVRTPFAMLDAHGPDDLERMVDGRRFYANAAECDAYLSREYPWWKQAAPIMDALHTAIHHRGDLVGSGNTADRCDVSIDAVYRLARGHKSVTLKQVRAAVQALAPVAVVK